MLSRARCGAQTYGVTVNHLNALRDSASKCPVTKADACAIPFVIGGCLREPSEHVVAFKLNVLILLPELIANRDAPPPAVHRIVENGVYGSSESGIQIHSPACVTFHSA